MTVTPSTNDRPSFRPAPSPGGRLRRVLGLSALVCAWCAAGGPLALSAQSPLERVEELTRMGRTEEARAALVAWWDEDREDASRRDLQRGLWLRGRLTVDPVQAELDFRRLVVLYPSGQFTPDAILRLAQASWAMGDEESAKNYVAMLDRDYGSSSARTAAAAWMADAGPVPPAGDTPTRASGGEPGRAVEGAAAGAAAVEDPPARPAGAEETPAASPEAAAGPPMNYFVQLGAFGEEERALALADEAIAQGVDARVVHVEGSRFTHVRVGRFADRAAAVELLEALTARGMSAALVRDDRPETPIRDQARS